MGAFALFINKNSLFINLMFFFIKTYVNNFELIFKNKTYIWAGFTLTTNLNYSEIIQTIFSKFNIVFTCWVIGIFAEFWIHWQKRSI